MVSILIRRPIDEVFDFVMSIEQTPRWRPRMSKVEWISDAEPGEGSRFQVTVRALGFKVVMRPEIVLWDPPHRVTYRVALGRSLLDSYMEWSPEDGACRFRMGGDPKPSRWAKPIMPLLGSSILRQNLGDLVRLKTLLEAGDGAG